MRKEHVIRFVICLLLAVSMLLVEGCSSMRSRRHRREEPAPLPEEIVLAPEPLAPAPTPAPDPVATEGKTYKVQSGDVLSKIAKRHGVSTRDLIELNNISDPNKIRIGQVLQLPAGAKAPKARSAGSDTKTPAAVGPGETYVVQKGDCLSKIAAREGTSAKSLREYNNLTSDMLQIGQKLVIPPGSDAVPAPAPAAPEPATMPPMD